MPTKDRNPAGTRRQGNELSELMN